MHSETVSKGAHSSLRLFPVFACTSHILAPSQCMAMPFSFAKSLILMISSWGNTMP